MACGWALWLAASPGRVHAQQSLFNVPSGLGTPAGAVFVQEQLVVEARGTSALTVQGGLTDWLEIGVNSFGVRLYSFDASEAESLSLGNLVSTFDLGPWASVQLGLQAGVRAPSPAHELEGAVHGWAQLRFEGGPFGAWIVGAYAGNDGFVGHGNNVGAWLGADIPLLPHRLYAMFDLILGNNEPSVGVVGLVVDVAGCQLSLGVQVPSLGGGRIGGVVEVSILR